MAPSRSPSAFAAAIPSRAQATNSSIPAAVACSRQSPESPSARCAGDISRRARLTRRPTFADAATSPRSALSASARSAAGTSRPADMARPAIFAVAARPAFRLRALFRRSRPDRRRTIHLVTAYPAHRPRRVPTDIRRERRTGSTCMDSGLQREASSASCSRAKAPVPPGCRSSVPWRALYFLFSGLCCEPRRLLWSGRRGVQSRHRESAAAGNSDRRANQGEWRRSASSPGREHGGILPLGLRGARRQAVRLSVFAGAGCSCRRGNRNYFPVSGDHDSARRRHYGRRIRRDARRTGRPRLIHILVSLGGNRNG